MLGDDFESYEFTTQTMLFLGVLALGVALGAAWGLTELQTSCIEAGKLPTPGTTLIGGDLNENACWQGAKRLQSIANYTGGAGAVLLLCGGVLDRYEERVREVFA